MSWANVPKGTFWWLWRRCPPLPIPNREVKPVIADDTAHVRGKVGRRQSSTEGVPKEAPSFCFMDSIDTIDLIVLLIVVSVTLFFLHFYFFCIFAF